MKKANEELQTSLKACSSAADDMSKKWKMLKAVVAFQTTEASQERLSLEYVGPCPGASISVSFSIVAGKFVSCLAKIDSSVYPKHLSRNIDKYKNLMGFLRNRTQIVCDRLSTTKFRGTEDVGDLLRGAFGELKRAEMTANEICKIQRRYDATISPSEFPVFVLRVQFANTQARSRKMVVAAFELSKSYPFDQMEAEIDVVEGEVDIDSIQGKLVKTAKPGYGYLIRACDVIAASLS